jgi:hypothetical protein
MLRSMAIPRSILRSVKTFNNVKMRARMRGNITDKIESEVRQILIEAMKAQLEKPTRACVNSEACFVA